MQGWFPHVNPNGTDRTPGTTIALALFLSDISIYIMTRHETPNYNVCMCIYTMSNVIRLLGQDVLRPVHISTRLVQSDLASLACKGDVMSQPALPRLY